MFVCLYAILICIYSFVRVSVSVLSFLSALLWLRVFHVSSGTNTHKHTHTHTDSLCSTHVCCSTVVLFAFAYVYARQLRLRNNTTLYTTQTRCIFASLSPLHSASSILQFYSSSSSSTRSSYMQYSKWIVLSRCSYRSNQICSVAPLRRELLFASLSRAATSARIPLALQRTALFSNTSLSSNNAMTSSIHFYSAPLHSVPFLLFFFYLFECFAQRTNSLALVSLNARYAS